jgi:hypothetical protein
MCDATTIAISSLAVGGATAAAGIVGQNEAYDDALADREARSQEMNRRYLETARETTRDVFQQIDTLRIQRDQVRQATFSQIRAVADDARKAMGVTAARNAERGITGRTAQSLVDEFERDFMNFENLKLTELADRNLQYNLEEQAIRNRGQSIINSGMPQPLPTIRAGNPLVPILQGATAGLGVAGTLSSLANTDMLRGLGTAPSPQNYQLPQTNFSTPNPFAVPAQPINPSSFSSVLF